MVSIIIPIYNVKGYLRECLDSVCNQTYREIEIILVDDGSTDGSSEVCDEYAALDDRVIVIHKENGGLVSARKAGIGIATGDYVLNVDGDDWIDIDLLKQLEEYINGNNAVDVVAFGFVEEHALYHGVRHNAVEAGVYRGHSLQSLKESMLMPECFGDWSVFPNIWAKVIKRGIIQERIKHVWNTVSYGEDVACTYPCIFDAQSVVVTDITPYHYRYRDGSISKTQKEISLENIRGLYQILMDAFGTNARLAEQIKNYIFFVLLVKGYSKIKSNMPLFPFTRIKKKNRVLVYGAGSFGKVITRYIREKADVELVAWADKNAASYIDLGYDVIVPEEIVRYDFDKIVIAILDEGLCQTIKMNLMELGIAEEKIDYVKKEVIEKEELPVWLVSG